jgi:predicted DNA-binding transcriptional regulator AlpA
LRKRFFAFSLHGAWRFSCAEWETIMTHQILLTVQQAAARLQISVDTLNRWRITGEGPPFLKYGPRLVRYDEADLEALGARTDAVLDQRTDQSEKVKPHLPPCSRRSRASTPRPAALDRRLRGAARLEVAGRRVRPDFAPPAARRTKGMTAFCASSNRAACVNELAPRARRRRWRGAAI